VSNLSNTVAECNLSSESRSNFRTTPCWLSAIYIVTMIAAVALQVVLR
jgi:hypothetical protein